MIDLRARLGEPFW